MHREVRYATGRDQVTYHVLYRTYGQQALKSDVRSNLATNSLVIYCKMDEVYSGEVEVYEVRFNVLFVSTHHTVHKYDLSGCQEVRFEMLYASTQHTAHHSLELAAHKCDTKRGTQLGLARSWLVFLSFSWLVVGDFNAVLGAYECLDSRSHARGPCEDFKSMIEDCNLIGNRFQGAGFTWVRGRSSRARVERSYWARFFWSFLSALLEDYRDRHIEVCIALAFDCVNVLHKKFYEGNVAMKMDNRKAFDTLDWKFLCRVLRAFGFSQTFMDWIVSILGSLRLSVLFNGSLTVWCSVYNVNRLGIDCMRNCVDDLLNLYRFGLCGRLGKASIIKSVVRSPPTPGWIKVNTNGAALGSPGVGGCGDVFRTCRSFAKACFAVPLGQVTWRVCQDWQRCLHQISNIEFQVSHIFREGNQETNALSKHDMGLSYDSWWSSTPSFYSSLIGYDCMGRESFRFS
ncbi:hypothetical protein Ddye_032215 [Dipteronia dyeriana]|uniref:Reverse transcriptase domain-containing protein n=1 Tax=Dipteronia dyeriana TaxID=168575 RepID=A0AAD9TKD0_9ROSI|nr:hypothetical protein Ddye_032215 [Dipteronia dyeriana]